MNELQTIFEAIPVLHQILVTVVFFLGMVLFTYKLGDSPTSLAYVALALVAISSPIVVVVLLFA